MIVEFVSCKIWHISDKTILLIACKGMHLHIRSDKTFIRSYTIKNSSYKILHDKNSSYKILHDKNSSYKILHDKKFLL